MRSALSPLMGYTAYTCLLFGLSRTGQSKAEGDVAEPKSLYKVGTARSEISSERQLIPIPRVVTMSSVQSPTYFLAPNWSFRPGGRIAIGSIIINPLKPHMVLSKPDPTKSPYATHTITEKNWSLSLETVRSLSLSLWGTFLQVSRLGLATDHERTKSATFTMTSLDTITLLEDVSMDELKARCNENRVQKYMRLDSVYRNPVYMITGIKLAKDFKLEGEKSSTNAVEMEAGGQVSPEVGLGGGAGVAKTTRIADGFEADGDVIFAYQLMKIKPKGWTKDKVLKTSEYEHRQAFLSDSKSDTDQKVHEVEGEADAVTRDDFESCPDAQIIEIDGVTVGYEASTVTKWH
ncbi:hypothetical protein J4E80_004226 [Alternaria sp. BMP 0032]|nr:hypothetical protein J4E80_004226 [Alternaria sp. BMP 0032]